MLVGSRPDPFGFSPAGLNRGADDVLRMAGAARAHGQISVVTAQIASINDPEQRDAVINDVDEAIWEEMQSVLRHQGRITPNSMILIALGGMIAAAGLLTQQASQAIAFVSASLIAPGFEPIAKIPLGIALRRWQVAQRGFVAVLVGYVLLIGAAALMFGVLRLVGATSVDQLVNNPEVQRIAKPGLIDILVSAIAAVAGITMLAAYRRTVIAGPLIAIVIIPAAALIGAGLVAGQPRLMYEGLERLVLDTALIVVLGTLVVWFKQATVHRRLPLV